MIRPESPLFSVVTVCLNAGNDLRATSQSVGSQTYRDFEYLIKDGGSTDGSVAGLPPEPGLRVICQPDTGIYDAMNQALAESRGGYVVFMNAGDRFHAETVLAQVAHRAEEAGWPEFVYTDSWNCRDRLVMHYPPELSRRFLYHRSLHHQAVYTRRDFLLERGGFDATDFRIFADHEFLVRAIIQHGARAVHCPVIGCDYDGAGFSTLAGNRGRLQTERKAIQRAHFTVRERGIWDLIYALTLPGLRVALMRRGGERLKRVYLGFARRVKRWENRNLNQQQIEKDKR